jgi:NTE family protein
MEGRDREATADPTARQPDELDRADGVFEGGGVKGIAFAGAVRAVEEELGVRDWVNVAGTSAGAITAALLVAGYDAVKLNKTLEETPYPKFADYGFGGRWLGAPLNALRLRGIARGEYFKEWLRDRFEDSRFKKQDPTFADARRDDLPADLPQDQAEAARYRLRVIASDITEGRMLILPDDIDQYADADGNTFKKDEFPLVDAVRMSMSFPFFFDPVTLYRGGRPHLIVDGGLLSNFPVWLFDSPRPVRRWTLGFRLHRGEGPETPPYREIPRPFWPLPLGKAMFFAATEAWDRRMAKSSEVRTVSIPTGDIPTLKFKLTEEERRLLYRFGYERTRQFLDTQAEYLNSEGQRAAGPAIAGTRKARRSDG